MNPLVLLCLSIAFGVVSGIGIFISVTKKKYGWTALCSVLFVLFFACVPTFYDLLGRNIPVLDAVVQAMKYLRPWGWLILAPWLGYIAYHAYGNKKVVDGSGIHDPATGTTAKSQPVLAGLIGLVAMISLVIGIVLLSKDYESTPHPEAALRELSKVANKADRKIGKPVYRARMEPEFGISIPADQIDATALQKIKGDVMKELTTLTDFAGLKDIQIVVVRHESSTSHWNLTDAIVDFQRDNPDKPGEFLPGIEWFELECVLSEQETVEWAENAKHYIVNQYFGDELQQPEEIATSSYTATSRGQLSSPAVFSRTGHRD
ncbi:MAG: hypothetical protein WCV62_00700 [Candidatus Peribacteraceae bacterium]|jgi:hypothetical protein